MRPEIDEDILRADFICVFKGKRLGSGVCREVFECKFDAEVVIKIEKYASDFNNVMELQIWQQVKGTEFEPYFAPCIDISPCGTVLLQKKCGLPEANDFPEQLPAFMNQDTKYQNFGLYEGRLVMTDYGNWRITDNMKTCPVEIDWWNDERP